MAQMDVRQPDGPGTKARLHAWRLTRQHEAATLYERCGDRSFLLRAVSVSAGAALLFDFVTGMCYATAYGSLRSVYDERQGRDHRSLRRGRSHYRLSIPLRGCRMGRT